LSKKRIPSRAPVAREELRDALTLTCWGQRSVLEDWFALPSPQRDTAKAPTIQPHDRLMANALKALDRDTLVRIHRIVRNLPRMARKDAATVEAVDNFITKRLKKSGAR
jgi:hypothetical protein